MANPHEINLLSPDNVENPYPTYRAMRESEPVYFARTLGFYIVSRYADARAVLTNEAVFSSKQGAGLQRTPSPAIIEVMKAGWPPVHTLLTNDPPSHTRFRALVTKAFSARRVATMEPMVRTIAGDLVDRFIGDRRVELISQFAVGLPLTVIADALGVPRDDMDRFKRWSDDSVAPLGGMITEERELECARSMVEMQHYFAARIEQRRSAPRDDLLSDLAVARLDGVDPLDMAELLSIIQQLLVAGNETTTNLIGSAMMYLVRNPALMATIAADRALIANFVEEALRMESPVQQLFRNALVDTEIGGVKIPAGSRILVSYASANRDDAQFADADTLEPGRANAREHLAFGLGVHFCIGAALARLEGRIAFETLFARLKNIRLVPDKNDFRHVPSFILRGLRELWLEFDPS
jgi:cytochrome P450